ncbi:unnamed protein product [Lampetra planeri]
MEARYLSKEPSDIQPEYTRNKGAALQLLGHDPAGGWPLREEALQSPSRRYEAYYYYYLYFTSDPQLSKRREEEETQETQETEETQEEEETEASVRPRGVARGSERPRQRPPPPHRVSRRATDGGREEVAPLDGESRRAITERGATPRPR